MGVDGSKLSYLKNALRFFRADRKKCVALALLIQKHLPDLVGLVEVDGGSFRAGFKPQWQEAALNGGYSVLARGKYGPYSIWDRIPILRMNMNAILHYGGPSSRQNEFYLPFGMKRLVLRHVTEDLNFYLVHFALDYLTRQRQLEELSREIRLYDNLTKTIVAGDFNTFSGRAEFHDFLAMTGFKFGSNKPCLTFPAYAPRMELDNLLVSPDIKVSSYKVLPDIISDHRAILMDIER